MLRQFSRWLYAADIATLVSDLKRTGTEHVLTRATAKDLVRARQGFRRRGADITALRIRQHRQDPPGKTSGVRPPSNRRVSVEDIQEIRSGQVFLLPTRAGHVFRGLREGRRSDDDDVRV